MPFAVSSLPAPLRQLAGKVAAKQLDKWLPGYLAHAARERLGPRWSGHRHLLFAFCDHYEPRWKSPTEEVARARVARWTDGYPALAAGFRDADGRGPRHSFFFPGEEYAPEYLDGLAQLARAGHGEVELHLHHDGDTVDGFRRDVATHLGRYAEHGHLARDPDGRLRYAFIHGNWCLANARSDGRWCGIDAELPLLFETGCYADFTFPAAPDESQPRVVNQIYWPEGDLGRRRAYDPAPGVPVTRARVGQVRDDRVLIIEGPLSLELGFDLPRRRFARIENADVTGNNPATRARVDAWVRQNIHVAGRPEWVFVKVHTHGTQEAHADALLGGGARVLHESLAAYNDGARWSLHYVTAREMYNVAKAAMAGKTGNPADFFDFELPPPPIAR